MGTLKGSTAFNLALRGFCWLSVCGLVTLSIGCSSLPVAVARGQPPTASTLPPASSTNMPSQPALTQTSVSTAPATIKPSVTPSATPAAPPTTTPTLAGSIYVFPLQPPGVASYQRGHHDYPATDIFAPQGSSFVAVTSGKVDFVSYTDTWDPKVDDPATRGGLSVAIVGDDGVRYYGSHLLAVAPGIEPGVRVEAGQLLGYVGRSGNARYVAPHLHFGVSHPTFPEDWAVRRGEIDPYPYLKAWEAGEMLTPHVEGAP